MLLVICSSVLGQTRLQTLYIFGRCERVTDCELVKRGRRRSWPGNKLQGGKPALRGGGQSFKTFNSQIEITFNFCQFESTFQSGADWGKHLLVSGRRGTPRRRKSRLPSWRRPSVQFVFRCVIGWLYNWGLVVLVMLVAVKMLNSVRSVQGWGGEALEKGKIMKAFQSCVSCPGLHWLAIAIHIPWKIWASCLTITTSYTTADKNELLGTYVSFIALKHVSATMNHTFRAGHQKRETHEISPRAKH